jgi:DNA polymerase III epsilon subunit-like protein
MVAHNASFDWKFVMTRCGMLKLPTSTLKSLETFDSLTFMRVFIKPIGDVIKHDEFFKRLREESKNKNGELKELSFALDKITKSFGVLDPAKSHTAFKDVENTVKVLAKLVVMLKHLGEYTPGDLDNTPEEVSHPEETEHLKSTDITDSLRAAVIKMESYKQSERTRRFNREVKKNKEKQNKYLQRVRETIDTERAERLKRRSEKP